MNLKERLYRALIDNPMTIMQASKEIGVGHMMLCRFLKTDHELSFKSMLMIEKWLKQKALE